MSKKKRVTFEFPNVKPRHDPPPDPQLHVYGVGCTWHGKISEVGKTPEENGISLPCCPRCGSMLFQTNEQDFWRGAEKFAIEQNVPNYVHFLHWLNQVEKCWPKMKDAVAEYSQSTGNILVLP